LCQELRLGSGIADIVFVSPSGRITIVECKLWRNPESRRKVVGQILDYAAALARLSYADLTAKLRPHLTQESENPIYAAVRKLHPDVDEVKFVECVSDALETGKFCLIVAGDGIQRDVQVVGEYLRRAAALAFSFGLVQVDIYEDGASKMLAPRVVAKTQHIDREYRPVISSPEMPAISNAHSTLESGSATADQRAVRRAADRDFWSEFINWVRIDHPDQERPRHGGQNWVRLSLPGQVGWLTLFRARGNPRLGAFIRFPLPDAREAYESLEGDSEAIANESGFDLVWEDASQMAEGYATVGTYKSFPDLDNPATYGSQREWFQRVANGLISAFRPRLTAFSDDA
jgi:hypothetical protein